jgi:hypothetical protein
METEPNPKRGVSQIYLKVKEVEIRPEVLGVSGLATNRSDIHI